jgi:hypothetical protein
MPVTTGEEYALTPSGALGLPGQVRMFHRPLRNHPHVGAAAVVRESWRWDVNRKLCGTSGARHHE